MTAAALPVTALAPMMREAWREDVRDKGYRRYPIGAEVATYIRAIRWSGASDNTIESYESVLAKLALDHADLPLKRFADVGGTEYLMEFLERNWGDASDATKAQRAAVLRSFFRWALDNDRIGLNPAKALKAPRARHRERFAYPRETLTRLVVAQPWLRDQAALELFTTLALRRNDVRLLQIGDIDLTRNLVVLKHGKGGRIDILPLGFKELRQTLYLHIVGDSREPDEYLLYPRSDPTRPMGSSSVHRWFKRCLAQAGLPTSMKLHELRHSAGDDFYRRTRDIVQTQKLMRHESLGTTQGYMHPTRDDLAARMREAEETW